MCLFNWSKWHQFFRITATGNIYSGFWKSQRVKPAQIGVCLNNQPRRTHKLSATHKKSLSWNKRWFFQKIQSLLFQVATKLFFYENRWKERATSFSGRLAFKQHNKVRSYSKRSDLKKLTTGKRLDGKSKQTVCRACCNISDLLALAGMSKKWINQ